MAVDLLRRIRSDLHEHRRPVAQRVAPLCQARRDHRCRHRRPDGRLRHRAPGPARHRLRKRQGGRRHGVVLQGRRRLHLRFRRAFRQQPAGRCDGRQLSLEDRPSLRRGGRARPEKLQLPLRPGAFAAIRRQRRVGTSQSPARPERRRLVPQRLWRSAGRGCRDPARRGLVGRAGERAFACRRQQARRRGDEDLLSEGGLAPLGQGGLQRLFA